MTPPIESSSPSRRILVTGAAGALGRSVVSAFLDHGDRVFGTHFPGHPPKDQNGPEWIAADLSERSEVRALFDRVGGVDAVVHCAGGFRFSTAESISDEDLRFLISVNFESAYFVASAAIPGMKERGGGSLLFVSSLATRTGASGVSAYVATKSAVNGLVLSLSEELKTAGIRVNAVLPSTIDTEANRRDMPKADFSKWVPTAEIAELLRTLTLPKSKSITGALIAMPGGL